MRKVNNFIFVPNMQHGACLLFDRKGLGRYQSWDLGNNRLTENLLYLFRLSQKHIRIQGVLIDQLRHY